MAQKPLVQLATRPTGTWVQVDRAALERWAVLATANPRAASVMAVIVAQMGRHNALVASQTTLARLAGCSLSTVKRALEVLRAQNWIEIRQLGQTGTVNAIVVNSRVAWQGARDGIRYAMFDAVVIAAEDDQLDRAELDTQKPLEAVPAMFPGEMQLPAGDGLLPPSQPALTGLEPELPARRQPAPSPPITELSRAAAILAELDARNAPDIDYRSAFSTGAKNRLRRGETWRGRLEAWVKA